MPSTTPIQIEMLGDWSRTHERIAEISAPFAALSKAYEPKFTAFQAVADSLRKSMESSGVLEANKTIARMLEVQGIVGPYSPMAQAAAAIVESFDRAIAPSFKTQLLGKIAADAERRRALFEWADRPGYGTLGGLYDAGELPRGPLMDLLRDVAKARPAEVAPTRREVVPAVDPTDDPAYWGLNMRPAGPAWPHVVMLGGAWWSLYAGGLVDKVRLLLPNRSERDVELVSFFLACAITLALWQLFAKWYDERRELD